MPKQETFVDKLVDILVKSKTVTAPEAKVYRQQFEESDHDAFDDFLISEGLISKEDLLKALSTFYEVPSVDVDGYYIDGELVRNFPKDFLIVNEVIPLEMEDDFLVVAAVNPSDPNLLSRFGKYTSEDIQFQVGIAQDIIDAIEEYHDRSLTDSGDIYRDLGDEDTDEEREKENEFEKDGEIDSEE
jgi:hypothetical protein